MNDRISDIVEDILGGTGDSLAQDVSTKTLDDVTFHDFAKYEFLLNPEGLRRSYTDVLSEDGAKYIDDLQQAGTSNEILEYMADLLTRLESNVRRGCADGLPGSVNSTLPQTKFAISYASLLPAKVLKPLYTVHRRLIRTIVDLDRAIPDFLDFHLYGDIRHKAKKMAQIAFGSVINAVQGYSKPLYDWVFFVETVNWWVITPNLEVESVDLSSDVEYPFEFYPAGTINVGIALVYRQRWKTLGIQPGEVVRTIPLGPGQSEKVVTKITRRRKTTSSMESSTESETTTESSDTTKDSSEVVNEASSKFNWNVSAKASYGIGGFGGSVSTDVGGSRERSSKDTSSSLSEVMKKTASKIRRQTKVSVKTETEIGFEESSTSEVRNNNDEVALTLQYHMLQHQYEVHTYLFAVRNAVFVAEEVPAPYEIDANWVRRYDWIIADELIDESFRATLNELIQDAEDEDPIDFDDQSNPYASMLTTARNKFAGFDSQGGGGGLGGLSVPDIYAEPQRQFDYFRKGEAARRRANRIRDARRSRLYSHIRDNILHYCRAIWAREDNEQRMLRYRKEGRTVPYMWKGPLIQSEVNASQFEPDGQRVSVDEIVSDITPIGFIANYVVFGIVNSDRNLDSAVEVEVDSPDGEIRLPLQELLNVVRSAYTNESGTELRDPALDFFLEEADGLLAADPEALRTISDEKVLDFLTFLPHLRDELVDENGDVLRSNGLLVFSISSGQWAEYLFRQNATRRFLLDSNNLYVSLLLGDGVALEPFKRVHRYIDVLMAEEERRAASAKNERRVLLKNEPQAFDPDISKVVVVSNKATDSDVVGGLLEDGDTSDDDG